MICAQCGTAAAPPAQAQPAQATVCSSCRLPLGRTECPDCTAGLFGTERFCPWCGGARKGLSHLLANKAMKRLEPYLPERVLERLLQSESGVLSERKYIAVLFATLNLPGVSEDRPAEAVAEMTNTLFEGLVAAVHRYDGTVDKFIGDGLLALFGAPVSHDNDPERAVLAAIDMMAFLRERSERQGGKVELAAGIHAGPVVAGSVGGHGRLNYTAVGDAVTLAQRLEGQAGPGRILVTREVYQRAREAVRFKTLPPTRLKGKRNPVDIWEARERRARGEAGRSQRFIGRAATMQALKAQLLHASGRLVGLVGEAGVGRTAVVNALLAAPEAKQLQSVVARPPAYGADAGAGLLTDCVAQLLKVRLDQGVGALKDAKVKLVELGLTEQEAALLLAGAAREKLDTALLDYEGTLRATSAAFLRVAAACAKRQRVLVVLEDVHWVTHTVRAQLLRLLEAPLPAGVSLLVTMRPEGAPLLEAAPNVSRVLLEPLSVDETRALVADRLGLAVVDAAVADKIQSASHGNPRMVEELLQSFMDQGAIFRSRGRWLISPRVTELPVPPSLEGLVCARIDELDGDARRFLQAAAVVGTRFEPDVVQRVGGLQVDVEWVLSQLVDRRLLVADDGRLATLRFAHELYREVAANGLAPAERQGLHQRVGRYLTDTADMKDPRMLQAAAFHLARAEEHEEGARFLLMAALRLVDVHQVDTAVQLLEDLLRIAAPLGYQNHELSNCETELDTALYHLGMLELRRGRVEKAQDYLQWAYARARHFFNGDIRVWALLGMGHLQIQRGQYAGARKFLELAAVDSEGMRDPALLTLAMLERARLFNAEGAFDQAIEAANRALELEKKITPELRANLPQRVSPALILLERAIAHHKAGALGEAASALVDAYKFAEQAQDSSARGHAALALAKVAAARKDFQKAHEYSVDALRCFRATGDRIAEGRCIHNFAVLELARGNRPRAEEAAAQAHRIFAEVGHRDGVALVLQLRKALAAPPAQKAG